MKLVKKNLIKLITVFVIGFSCIGDVFAYEFPTDSFYISIVDSALGEITIYFPSNQVESISLEENYQIVNTGSSNITGYSNDVDFTFSFQPYQLGRYRKSNTANYEYLDIISVVGSNFPIKNESTVWLSANSNLITTSIFLIGGAFLLLIWLKL